jgi:hypothetical protein
MPSDATFESFEKELNCLVESFGDRLAELKSADYNEAKLRDDFLNPFFRALGWDMENRAGLIQKEREVEIESTTQIGGGRKRADYLPNSSRGSLYPMASGGFTITIGAKCTLKPAFVLGILNSKLSFWFLRQISNIFRGGWITCTKSISVSCQSFASTS